MNADDRSTFTFEADPGTTWAVEASVDLVHWIELGRTTATGASVTFTDEAPTREPQRFYRLRQVK